ncbi:hypothetical protein A6770_32780 [Nostoc minutum NIES-26]|uniref:Uncharacterized protein n=1 Tax=Nostoc minutum NIES-26 TaxID=1844469 RepID=A0A367Q382_9NOSO|nr:hypothetical protein A6770_32780 [Nostoc minutum NIES-26]
MLTVPKSTARIGKKVFKFQVAVIASILLLSNFSSAWGQRQPVARGNLKKPVCKPVARIISGDLRRVAGSKVCEEDRLQPVAGATVEVLCYLSGNILNVSGGAIGKQCSSRSQTQSQHCTSGIRGDCLKVKGPDDENVPTLIVPYSPLILNSRPSLSWTAIPGAISYIVQIEGTGVNWSKEVNSISLPYSKEQPAMQPGNIYQVNVLAKMAEQKFIASQSILMVASLQKAEQTKAIIERIQNLNLPPDELAVDIESVYKGQNLLTEAIEVLKERVKAKTQNPTIYRLLGDRYLNVGSPEQAMREYKMAIQYAKLRGNLNELAQAQAGLKLLLQSQLPTRTNPDQK